MTSQAKAGLLLGLALIFMVAFLINGLPKVGAESNNNELTSNMIKAQSRPAALAYRERKAVTHTMPAAIPYTPPRSAPANPDEKVRFKMALPGAQPNNEPQNTIEKTAKTTAKNQPKKAALPGYYTVTNGDNLAVIAKKIYGPLEGNKKTNIDRIFEVNSGNLISPDKIHVGQRLLIPAINNPESENDTNNNILASGMFRKVKSIAHSRLAETTGKTKHTGRYTVREGDSLWQIAQKFLGDGSRYKEILELNADVLAEEDDLAIGTPLKLPSRP